MIYNGKFCLIILCSLFFPIFSVRSFEDFSWDDPRIESLLNSTNFEQTRAPADPVTVVKLLEQFGIINLLQENLYDKSYPLNARYILDLPLFTFPWYHSRCKEKGYQFFFNWMPKMTFRNECDKISSYLAIAGNGFVEKLQTSLEEISAVYPFNPEVALELLTLFEHFTVQERSLGVMIDGEKKICNGVLRYFIPIYWHERNHFISNAVQKAINNILDPITGKPDPEASWAFAEQYLIADQLGIGDLRFEYDIPFVEGETFKARAGFMLDLPIAFSVGFGLLGSHFKPPKCRPMLDLEELFTVLLSDDPTEIANFQGASNFLTGALNNLSAILLNTATGNYGHIGLGFMARTRSTLTKFVKRPWAEPIYFHNRVSIEYLLPGTEFRSFVPKNNASAFASRNFESDDPVIARQNLAFIQQTLTDRFFPPFIQAIVFPGFVIRMTSRTVYEGPVWGFFVGSDTWLRTKEHISSLETSDCGFNSLNIASAERPLAYQSKMFAGIMHHICTSGDTQWALSLNYDTTVLRSGIGKDSTLTLNIDVNF